MVIGLTGGIGTGKSTVIRKLKEKGFAVIDLDIISREVIEYPSVINKIVKNFGKEVLENENAFISERKISRKKLGKNIFTDRNRRDILNSLMHPVIIKKMKEEIEKAKKISGFVIVEVQLLFEINLEKEFDITVLVYSDRDTQLKRVMERDGKTEKEVLDILNSQLDIEIKKDKSDYIIKNTGDLKNLDEEIEKFIKNLESLQGGKYE